ncbi:unnamed protein product [Coregonus sp. 'balchen']|nr:unnamed protein product [Coregonus sp. 'balchen']
MTWREAQSYCRKHHTDLPSVKNQSENNKTQQVVRVRLTPKDHNMDLTDPDMQEAILQQIKKELKEKGMSDDVKLRWKEQPDRKIFHKEEKRDPQNKKKKERKPYYFVNMGKNWTEAQAYCRDKYTDMATIDNMEDMNRLLNTEHFGDYSDTVWIGLYDDVNSWRWSLEDSDYYSKGGAEFRNWQNGQPDNVNSNEHCVVMTEGGEWQDEDCNKILPFICYTSIGKNNSHVFIESKKNWSEAQSYCRESHTDLASVRNQTENQEIQKMVSEGSTVWIGLFRDSWKWSDGSASSFRYWWPEQPNNNNGLNQSCCAAVYKKEQTDRWFDWNCNDIKPFVCYSVKTTQQVVRVRLTPKDQNMDLTDPVIKKELREKGMSDDVKLRWKEQPDRKIFHKEEKRDPQKKERNPVMTKREF